MTNIYDQHNQSFRGVAAYVVLDREGHRLATVAFKFAHSGLRTTCYFHVLGFDMTKAAANGGGYDKASAAAYAAVRKIHFQGGESEYEQRRYDWTKAIVGAIKNEGASWERDLVGAGFTVLQAM